MERFRDLFILIVLFCIAAKSGEIDVHVYYIQFIL